MKVSVPGRAPPGAARGRQRGRTAPMYERAYAARGLSSAASRNHVAGGRWKEAAARPTRAHNRSQAANSTRPTTVSLTAPPGSRSIADPAPAPANARLSCGGRLQGRWSSKTQDGGPGQLQPLVSPPSPMSGTLPSTRKHRRLPTCPKLVQPGVPGKSSQNSIGFTSASPGTSAIC